MSIHKFRITEVKTIIIIAVTICIIYSYFAIRYERNNTVKDKITLRHNTKKILVKIKPINKKLSIDKSKKVLIWNTYWSSEAIWNKLFKQILDRKCSTSSANNCIFTNDKNELNSSDAILFHLADLHPEYSIPKLKKRNQRQVWIAMTYDPPFVLNKFALHFSKLNGIFNRTMSYRRDSDIVVHPGTFVNFKNFYNGPKRRHISMSFNGDWINSNASISGERNYASSKRRLVAWFASDCRTQSGRENYVKELQDYVEVDIYGECGKYRCGAKKTILNTYRVEFDDCYYLVSVSYKFVLAFENSICEDYVTEKLYNNLKLNVVPVVFGGGNYTELAPPNSVIDASKYSPKELADFLLSLDSNDTLYNEYFRWKKNYFIEAHDGVPLSCNLCLKLNDPTWVAETKVYEHLGAWIMNKCRLGYQRTS